ncbi:MAG: GpE family phage tail protein [Pseudomonas helleri]
MADIAMVFHWGPADTGPLTLTELIEWRERARQRWEASRGGK